MQKKWLLVCLLFGGLVSACVPQATDDEISTMCDNLVKLRGQIPSPSVETISSNITVKYDKETQSLQESLTTEEQTLKEEMQAKLDAAAGDDEKAKIKKEYEAALAELNEQNQPKLAALNAQKAEAMAEAKKAASENQAAWDEAVNECVVASKKDGVTQEVAKCRIQAETTDKYWNGCR